MKEQIKYTTSLGLIWVLKTRDFQRDYIGRCYKDEKAYSYYDGEFVDEILLHTPDVAIKIV